MDKKELSPTEVYSFLPKTNCGKCSESTCLTFAIKVVNRDVPLEKCSPLLTKANSKAYSQLEELLKPVVMEVVVGVGAKAVRIGGKHVMYRHEFVLFNPTAIAIDVTDTLSDVELLTRVKQVEQFSFDYIGQSLKLDMIAVRSVSNDPEKFKATARKVAENTTLPLILCSLNSRILEAGLTAVSTSRPLLYAATKANWQEVATLALRHDCPLVVHALNDLKLLRALVRKLLDLGVRDLVLDSGTFFGDGLAETLNNFTVIRRSACKRGDKLFGFPLLGIPLVAWLTHETHENIRKWREAYLAALLTVRFADIVILHDIAGWALLPLVVLRQNLYTDPRKPSSVKPGLRTFGAPDASSPVLFTTNFALTYHTVASDLDKAKIDAYLLVVDTGGIAVDSAVAGRKLTAEKVASAIKASGIENKVKHRTLLIPGKAARLRSEIEKLSQWHVLIGPKDSSEIQKFLQENSFDHI